MKTNSVVLITWILSTESDKSQCVGEGGMCKIIGDEESIAGIFLLSYSKPPENESFHEQPITFYVDNFTGFQHFFKFNLCIIFDFTNTLYM